MSHNHPRERVARFACAIAVGVAVMVNPSRSKADGLDPTTHNCANLDVGGQNQHVFTDDFEGDCRIGSPYLRHNYNTTSTCEAKHDVCGEDDGDTDTGSPE